MLYLCSGLNFQDLIVRQGAIDSPPKTPFILGFECAGEIEQVGEGVTNFKVGDQVVALPEYRAWAELAAVPAQYVYALPEGMSALDAVAITTNYVVAYLLLFEMANLTPGKSLLVHSAGGGVGFVPTYGIRYNGYKVEQALKKQAGVIACHPMQGNTLYARFDPKPEHPQEMLTLQ
ncbi:jg10614 [Pararge aegeria aegeria]|uniref:Jg10614 protein n=1 Tax=Pararge aegeria aegeria TaxID=348720 RepID=A0A8S4RYR4_9NEOP|nr:jg10614 [Pararge aegeria aegeria]